MRILNRYSKNVIREKNSDVRYFYFSIKLWDFVDAI